MLIIQRDQYFGVLHVTSYGLLCHSQAQQSRGPVARWHLKFLGIRARPGVLASLAFTPHPALGSA
ncbi:hypothetical protein KAM348_38220 [Aeromonas caviae]|uniref:Uncharacterized protein n=1 Tax=Aeromonas caviae TaxID=648 RepID=A0AAI9PBU2_AERCA|nr:hypothetical protein KAM348_38220 [Aeromonas caviae]